MATSSQTSPISFQQCFRKVPDPRTRTKNIIHPLVNILFMTLCGTIAGANDFQAIHAFAVTRREWFGKYLDLSAGIPSHDTLERVFSMLDPIAFQKCLLTWTKSLSDHAKDRLIQIDGKAVREAMARSEEKGPLCLVSAWASENHIFLGQVAAPEGSNELGAVPKLLEILDLEGALVTMDALSCQKEIVKQITEQGGEYVISVKGNQEKLEEEVHQRIGEALKNPEDYEIKVKEVKEQRGGKEERRIYTVVSVGDGFQGIEEWAGLKRIVMVVREYEGKKGQKQLGTRYYISSCESIKKITEAIRGHWGIENSLHWQLDVSFQEDRSRARKDKEQANLGIVRRTALSMIKNAKGIQGGINNRRLQAGWSEEILEKIVFGKNMAKV